MPFDLKQIVHRILDEYPLPRFGCHGVSHWARVMENGIRLAEKTGADRDVVRLFAVFHDSRRVSEAADPQHGQRGADFAYELWEKEFDIPLESFRLLYKACAGHTHELTHPDVTVQTCWDADRLDLGRVGVMPHASKLCTDVAKSKEMIRWADGRAAFHQIPTFVREEWGIEPDEFLETH